MDQSIVSQREIHVDTESYVTALRASLRQSPDVILLGEMRDYETMQVAMTAAETGHLIFSDPAYDRCSQHDCMQGRCISSKPAASDSCPVIHGTAGSHLTAACSIY